MSRTYVMDTSAVDVIEIIRAGKIPGLEHYESEEPDSLWTDGVTDGKDNYGWFEGVYLHFWGANNETEILDRLNQFGIMVKFGF